MANVAVAAHHVTLGHFLLDGIEVHRQVHHLADRHHLVRALAVVELKDPVIGLPASNAGRFLQDTPHMIPCGFTPSVGLLAVGSKFSLALGW